MEIRYLGHATFTLTEGEHTVLIDPWLSGPTSAIGPDEVQCTDILVTHGHFDHVGDLVPIAKRTGASVTAIAEIGNEVSEELGEGHTVNGMNFGGTVPFDWGWARFVPAWHSSTTPKGTSSIPGGFVISIGGKIVYHLGDTALFSDLALPGKRDKIDVALMCIGGWYTMDRHDAVEAAKLVGAAEVIPCHYDTFPPIATDSGAFKDDVEAQTSSKVVLLKPGETHTP